MSSPFNRPQQRVISTGSATRWNNSPFVDDSSSEGSSQGDAYAIIFDEGPKHDKYVLVEPLGVGVEADVFAVRSITDGELYVRKRFRSDREHRFNHKEVEILGRMPHHMAPRMVSHTVHNISHSTIYQPLCNGGNLFQLLKKHENANRQIPELFLWTMIDHMLETIARMHQGPIVSDPTYRGPWTALFHEDMNPGNWFFHWKSPDDLLPSLYLGDWGHSSTAEGKTIAQSRREEYRELEAQCHEIERYVYGRMPQEIRPSPYPIQAYRNLLTKEKAALDATVELENLYYYGSHQTKIYMARNILLKFRGEFERRMNSADLPNLVEEENDLRWTKPPGLPLYTSFRSTDTQGDLKDWLQSFEDFQGKELLKPYFWLPVSKLPPPQDGPEQPVKSTARFEEAIVGRAHAVAFAHAVAGGLA